MRRGRNIRDMNETIDSLFNFDEGAEIRQVSHASGDDRTYRVALRQRGPWIRFGLLESERYPAVFHVDIENHRFHVLIRR